MCKPLTRDAKDEKCMYKVQSNTMTIQIPPCILLVSFGIVLLCTTTMADEFKIGAFNIQVFGKKKADNPTLMKTISKILRRYDIVLIQEIRDKTGNAVKKLLQEVNKYSGKRHKYEMIVSDRLGRTHSKEQYAFFYRTAYGIRVDDSYHYDDGDEASKTDTFHREPFIVRFNIPQLVVKQIAFVAIHTDPDDAVAETKELTRVIDDVKNRWNDIEDIMVLGDLNADCKLFPKKSWNKVSLRTNSKYFWPIGDSVDTTTTDTDCAYDRFVLTGQKLISSYVKNSAGVYRFDKAYKLDKEQTLAVSDHYPIELQLTMERELSTTSYPEDDTVTTGCADRLSGMFSAAVMTFVSCFTSILNIRDGRE